MKYIEGFTLAEILKGKNSEIFKEPYVHFLKGAKLKTEAVVEIGIRVADALSFAHSHSILHRDIKPSNIFITSTGSIVVIDFGIARDPEMSSKTATGLIMGTPHYMSPEQIRGQNIDERSDLYSLGCVLFHCLCGRVPFTDTNEVMVCIKHLNDPIPDIRELTRDADVPKSLTDVVAKLLSKDKVDRFSSADELINSLTATLCLSGDLSHSSYHKSETKARAEQPKSSLIDASVKGLNQNTEDATDWSDQDFHTATMIAQPGVHVAQSQNSNDESNDLVSSKTESKPTVNRRTFFLFSLLIALLIMAVLLVLSDENYTDSYNHVISSMIVIVSNEVGKDQQSSSDITPPTIALSSPTPTETPEPIPTPTPTPTPLPTPTPTPPPIYHELVKPPAFMDKVAWIALVEWLTDPPTMYEIGWPSIAKDQMLQIGDFLFLPIKNPYDRQMEIILAYQVSKITSQVTRLPLGIERQPGLSTWYRGSAFRGWTKDDYINTTIILLEAEEELLVPIVPFNPDSMGIIRAKFQVDHIISVGRILPSGNVSEYAETDLIDALKVTASDLPTTSTLSFLYKRDPTDPIPNSLMHIFREHQRDSANEGYHAGMLNFLLHVDEMTQKGCAIEPIRIRDVRIDLLSSGRADMTLQLDADPGRYEVDVLVLGGEQRVELVGPSTTREGRRSLMGTYRRETRELHYRNGNLRFELFQWPFAEGQTAVRSSEVDISSMIIFVKPSECGLQESEEMRPLFKYIRSLQSSRGRQ